MVIQRVNMPFVWNRENLSVNFLTRGKEESAKLIREWSMSWWMRKKWQDAACFDSFYEIIMLGYSEQKTAAVMNRAGNLYLK